MGAKTLEIHPSALEELRSAVTWYLEQSPTAAAKFAAEVDRSITLVVESPARWPVGEFNTRKIVLRRFPFAIVYREMKDTVQILAVAHGRRRPGYWKDRL